MSNRYIETLSCQAPMRWHAADRPLAMGKSAGRSSRHLGMACGQRGWKAQPEGGAKGEGSSPRIGRKAEIRRTLALQGGATNTDGPRSRHGRDEQSGGSATGRRGLQLLLGGHRKSMALLVELWLPAVALMK